MRTNRLHLEQNERYLHLAGKLEEAKEQASSSKQDKNKQGQKVAQEKVRRIQQGRNSQNSPLISDNRKTYSATYLIQCPLKWVISSLPIYDWVSHVSRT